MAPAGNTQLPQVRSVERHSYLLLTTAAIVGVAPLMISVPTPKPTHTEA